MVNIPTVDLSELNNSLNSLANRVNLDQINAAAAEAGIQLQAATSTELGARVNQIVGGWQGLTQEIDDLAAGAAPNLQLAADAVQNVTGKLGGIASEVSSAIETGLVTEGLDTLSSSLQNSFSDLAAAGEQLAPALQSSLPELQAVANRGLAILQENPPGVNLITPLEGSARTALQSITGLQDEITEGLNVVVAALPTPEGIGAALESVSDLNLDELSDAIQSISPPNFRSLSLDAAIGSLKNEIPESFSQLADTVSSVTSSINSFLNQGFGQSVKDLIEATSNPIGFAVTQLTQSTGIRVPRSVNRQVASFLDAGNTLAAAELLSPFSDLDVVSLETELSGIKTGAANLINQFDAAFSELGTSTAPVFSIGSMNNSWNGVQTSIRRPGATESRPISVPDASTPAAPAAPAPTTTAPAGGGSTQSGGYAFTIVGSMEELEAELRSATREITELVLHWTANFIDQAHVGAEQIHTVHLNRGFSGCGYHYIIKRDGSIQRGRPVNIVGAHANDFGHNRFSIGISHVAGYNCVAGTPNPNSYISADSISDAGMRAQRDFIEVFYRVFPGGQVLGHNQISQQGKVDPGFDVDAYILNTFGKRNVYDYNRDRGPLSRAQLIEARGTATV